MINILFLASTHTSHTGQTLTFLDSTSPDPIEISDGSSPEKKKQHSGSEIDGDETDIDDDWIPPASIVPKGNPESELPSGAPAAIAQSSDQQDTREMTPDFSNELYFPPEMNQSFTNLSLLEFNPWNGERDFTVD